jgi:hypothetical protein
MAWFAGSALLGALYDWSVMGLVAASALLQGTAVPILILLARRAGVQ